MEVIRTGLIKIKEKLFNVVFRIESCFKKGESNLLRAMSHTQRNLINTNLIINRLEISRILSRWICNLQTYHVCSGDAVEYQLYIWTTTKEKYKFTPQSTFWNKIPDLSAYYQCHEHITPWFWHCTDFVIRWVWIKCNHWILIRYNFVIFYHLCLFQFHSHQERNVSCVVVDLSVIYF